MKSKLNKESPQLMVKTHTVKKRDENRTTMGQGNYNSHGDWRYRGKNRNPDTRTRSTYMYFVIFTLANNIKEYRPNIFFNIFYYILPRLPSIFYLPQLFTTRVFHLLVSNLNEHKFQKIKNGKCFQKVNKDIIFVFKGITYY